jgi:hypothetical protein
MSKRLSLVGVGVVIAVCLGAAAGASAATQFGDPCFAAAVLPESETVTIFQAAAPQSGLPMTSPFAGVITSWGLNAGSALAPGASNPVKLKVLRSDPTNKTAQVVGESFGTAVAGSNKFDARIPVQAGDRVALASDDTPILACAESLPGDALGLIEGDPAIGSTVPYGESSEVSGQIPLFATVEADADGDGYGDETQDQCPTDASTQGPCPVKTAPTTPPPAPTTLSASAAAKKTFLTVSLTTTTQASVTVTGTVKIGKGKPVKLSGNTQTVALGALAKFTVLFPAKLKAALKKLPTNKKLTISISASAPGAATKTLTVKVPGQEKVAHHRRAKA